MKQKILLIVYPSFADFEITVATALLGGRYDIVTAAQTLEPQVSEAGLVYQPGLTFDEVNPIDYEAIIIPGGDLFYVKDADRLFKIVQEFDNQKKLIAAICSAGYVLGRAGLLENNPYTVTLNEEQRTFLALPEATYRYDKYIWSDHILTAQGHAFVDFGLQIASYFNFVTHAHTLFFKGESNLMMEDTK